MSKTGTVFNLAVPNYVNSCKPEMSSPQVVQVVSASRVVGTALQVGQWRKGPTVGL